MSAAVHHVLDQIKRLTADDRLLLDKLLTELEEEEWRREAETARNLARERSLDQAAIDRAVEGSRIPHEAENTHAAPGSKTL